MSGQGGGWDFSQYTGHLAHGESTSDSRASQPNASEAEQSNDFFGGPTDHFQGTAAPVAAPTSTAVSPAPVWLLASAGGAAAAGGALALILGAPVYAAVAWLLSGPVGIALVALYLLMDTRRRTQVMYSPPTWAGAALAIVLALIFVSVIVASLQLAFWVGRL